ncbi:CocE/NonD family hydrolase [Nocardia sp. NPDC051321]|uniref:CocE/NonD family hydrolase n=1 Tax=Nocardia sp. NPDC051321 TaxID=3364323 RepID=UPI0037B33A27
MLVRCGLPRGGSPTGATAAGRPARGPPRLSRTASQLVDWAAKLPGANGKVGMYGYSFPALSAWRTAGSESPRLNAERRRSCRTCRVCSVRPNSRTRTPPGRPAWSFRSHRPRRLAAETAGAR